MKVDLKSEIVQWVLRTWVARLINIQDAITSTFDSLSDEITDSYDFLDGPERRSELFFKNLKPDTPTFDRFWMEYFSQKKIGVHIQEPLDDTLLPLSIENEATKDKWLKWINTLDFSDKNNSEKLAIKCYFMASYLSLLEIGPMEEMEFQSFRNTESVCFALVTAGSVFIDNRRAKFSKTLSAMRSAIYKAEQAYAKQSLLETIYKEYGCKNSIAFRTDAMQKTGWTEDYIRRKVKKM